MTLEEPGQAVVDLQVAAVWVGGDPPGRYDSMAVLSYRPGPGDAGQSNGVRNCFGVSAWSTMRVSPIHP
jgi:hypothetical protein